MEEEEKNLMEEGEKKEREMMEKVIGEQRLNGFLGELDCQFTLCIDLKNPTFLNSLCFP